MERDYMGIGRSIRILSNIFEATKNRNLAEIGLTCSQMDTLIYIGNNRDHPIYQKELEEVLHLTNPSVTGILNRLEKKGMIRREIDASDRRLRRIILCDTGCEILLNMRDGFHDTEDYLFGFMSDEDFEALYTQLTHVTEHAIDEWQKRNCCDEARNKK